MRLFRLSLVWRVACACIAACVACSPDDTESVAISGTVAVERGGPIGVSIAPIDLREIEILYFVGNRTVESIVGDAMGRFRVEGPRCGLLIVGNIGVACPSDGVELLYTQSGHGEFHQTSGSGRVNISGLSPWVVENSSLALVEPEVGVSWSLEDRLLPDIVPAATSYSGVLSFDGLPILAPSNRAMIVQFASENTDWGFNVTARTASSLSSQSIPGDIDLMLVNGEPDVAQEFQMDLSVLGGGGWLGDLVGAVEPFSRISYAAQWNSDVLAYNPQSLGYAIYSHVSGSPATLFEFTTLEEEMDVVILADVGVESLDGGRGSIGLAAAVDGVVQFPPAMVPPHGIEISGRDESGYALGDSSMTIDWTPQEDVSGYAVNVFVDSLLKYTVYTDLPPLELPGELIGVGERPRFEVMAIRAPDYLPSVSPLRIRLPFERASMAEP